MEDNAPTAARVYHPQLPSWVDVPTSNKAEWLEAGWLEDRPDDFPTPTEEEPAPGEAYTPPTVPNHDEAPQEVPAGNGSTEQWREYAIAQGASLEDVQELTRNEIRDQYSPTAL